jgi:cytoskeletal protein RodZ
MESIGHKLRETRERLGISLEEAERATRIRIHHLSALEEGDADSLPSPVQARGFLKNYADFLGLDVDGLLLEYAEWLQKRRGKIKARVIYDEPKTRPSVQVRSKRPRWLSSDLFIAAGISIAILALLVWGISRAMAALREGASPTEEVSSLLLPTVTSTPPPTARVGEDIEAVTPAPQLTPAGPTPTQAFVVGPTSQVNIQLAIEQRAWLQVIVDGEREYQGRALPGEVLEFLGEELVEVKTGNGSGVRVIFNGQDQGLMGELGEVVTRIWTLGGILTPTPTDTSTPTLVPTVTETPTPTQTAPNPQLTPQATTQGG